MAALETALASTRRLPHLASFEDVDVVRKRAEETLRSLTTSEKQKNKIFQTAGNEILPGAMMGGEPKFNPMAVQSPGEETALDMWVVVDEMALMREGADLVSNLLEEVCSYVCVSALLRARE